MPTYEYLCEACKHEWELEQRMTAEPVKKCPKCGKLKAHRQISQGNFILKGGGWYSDAYSSPSPKKKESASSSETSDRKSESKIDTKPEAKSETKSDAKSDTSSETKPKKAPKAAAE